LPPAFTRHSDCFLEYTILFFAQYSKKVILLSIGLLATFAYVILNISADSRQTDLIWLFLISRHRPRCWISRILLPFRGSVYCVSHKQVTLTSFTVMLQSNGRCCDIAFYSFTKICKLVQTGVFVSHYLPFIPSREIDRTSMKLTKPRCIELTS
jgi:hypothetical protein